MGGYSMQGICKFGFCEFFKNVYYGISQSKNPNQSHWNFPNHPKGSSPQNLCCRRPQWFLQILGSIVGTSNPIHYDEVCMLRKNCRSFVRLCRSQTKSRM